jgi:hypothetical protein
VRIRRLRSTGCGTGWGGVVKTAMNCVVGGFDIYQTFP